VCRSENSELHHSREVGRREQQDLSRENEKLIKKLETLSKYSFTPDIVWEKMFAYRPVERGEFSRAPRCYWGPAVAQKYWKRCSRWLLSDLNIDKINFRPGLRPGPRRGASRTPCSRMVGDTLPHVSSLLTPSASRSQRIRNEVVIGPRDGFPDPAVALDGPVCLQHRHE